MILVVGTIVSVAIYFYVEKKHIDIVSPVYKTTTLTIQGRQLNARISDTEQLRTIGLSGTPLLGSDEAMLFVFEKAGWYSFWMKDMLYPIDIIWLDQDKTIVTIKHNATPQSFPGQFSPIAKSQYVVETVAGFAKENDVQIGDVVLFDL